MTNDERQKLFADYERAAKSKDFGRMAEIWQRAGDDQILARWLAKLDEDVGVEIDKIQQWARRKYSASAQLVAFAAQPVLPDFGVGKWSRIATFGPKGQMQPDGEMVEWNFSPEKFKEAVANYARMFAQRRMGSDYEHQALHAPVNGRPAPNLCFWDGMACIEGDEVIAIQEQQPGPPPDPAALRALLGDRFPGADPDPGGLWMRCAEVTELGRLLIPSYEQLSPLFSEAQRDESGEEIGFAVSNISFVNVAHQSGTFFNFASAMNFTDAALHPSGPEKRRAMNEQEMMAKLGLADGCTKEELTAKFAEYQDSTQDPKEMRAAMRGTFSAKMKAFEGAPVPGEKDPCDAEKKAEQAAMSAQQQALSALSAQHQATTAELAQMKAREQQREQQAKTQRLAAFAGAACSPVTPGGTGTGQWDPSKRQDLEGLLNSIPEEKWPSLLAGVPKGAFGGGGRMFPGGNPAGTSRPGTGFAPAYALSQKTIGFSATQQAFALLEQRGVKTPDAQQLAAALREVGHQNPDSLRAALGPSTY